MGTPNNPPARSAVDILRDLARDPQSRLSEEDARAFGLDIDIVTVLYESEIRPSLDHLTGYRDLLELDPIRNRDLHRYGGVKSWEEVLGEHGQLKQHRQTLKIADLHLYWYGDRPQDLPDNAWVTVFLTRKGKWLLRYAGGRQQYSPENEQVTAYDTVGTLCEVATSLVPNGYTMAHIGGYGKPDFIPLSIAKGLLGVLATTNEQREKRLQKTKDAQLIAERRLVDYI